MIMKHRHVPNPLLIAVWSLVLIVSLCLASQQSNQNALYTSVSALNQYGESVQLRHARASSLRYGTCVVAAKSHCNDVIVVSLFVPRPGVLSEKNVLERVVAVVSDNDDSFPVYMACTGVKADATWLIQTIREYNTRTWERYNVSPSQSRVANALSEALLNFMGYDRSEEWHDGVGPIIVNGDNDNEDNIPWSRPLGLQTLVLSPTAQNVILVEPSGIQHAYLAQAIGRESDAVNRELQKHYKPNLDTQELKELLVDIVRKAMEDSNEKISEKAEIVIEMVSEQGVQLSTEPFAIKKTQ